MQVYGVSHIAKEICEYGSDHGFDYKLAQDSSFSFFSIWQPASVALFRIYNDQKPYILDLCLLTIAILIGSFQWTKPAYHKTWHNVWTLRKQIKKHGPKKDWSHIVMPLSFACLIFDIVSLVVFGNRHQAVVNYYQEKSHPNVRLALELIGKESGK
jgi:hypothetical protein